MEHISRRQYCCHDKCGVVKSQLSPHMRANLSNPVDIMTSWATLDQNNDRVNSVATEPLSPECIRPAYTRRQPGIITAALTHRNNRPASRPVSTSPPSRGRKDRATSSHIEPHRNGLIESECIITNGRGVVDIRIVSARSSLLGFETPSIGLVAGGRLAYHGVRLAERDGGTTPPALAFVVGRRVTAR
ncbi:hypothetical protein RRG08_054896 [Elysia crispata]|uniref:Uncharacterized protein n=1 Tax=Elysia crispata TaxID=231223 RepID=A0AAE1A7C2_9GAST|nr:hypothetical protein RRG08_054896 [Elysia crispata]